MVLCQQKRTKCASKKTIKKNVWSSFPDNSATYSEYRLEWYDMYLLIIKHNYQRIFIYNFHNIVATL